MMKYESLSVTRVGNGYLVEPTLGYKDRPEGWKQPRYVIQNSEAGEACALGSLILDLLWKGRRRSCEVG